MTQQENTHRAACWSAAEEILGGRGQTITDPASVLIPTDAIDAADHAGACAAALRWLRAAPRTWGDMAEKRDWLVWAWESTTREAPLIDPGVAYAMGWLDSGGNFLCENCVRCVGCVRCEKCENCENCVDK